MVSFCGDRDEISASKMEFLDQLINSGLHKKRLYHEDRNKVTEECSMSEVFTKNTSFCQ
jgi:hypothetical protein